MDKTTQPAGQAASTSRQPQQPQRFGRFGKLGRPRAATGADVTLTAETMLALPWRDHDKAQFGTWGRQYEEQNPKPVKAAEQGREAKVWRQENPFKLPDASPKLMWRLVRLYRDICVLCQNEQGFLGYCFASNKHFVGKYNKGRTGSRTENGTFAPASEPTIRRWISILVEHGWIGSEVCGPDRKLWPLIHPSSLLKLDSLRFYVKEFFERHFKRLLTATLSALTPSLPIVNPDKGNTKNKGKRAPKVAENKPLTPALTEHQQAVVAVIAEQFGVDTDWSSEFVRRSDKATSVLTDALDATRLAREQGKLKFNAAGYLRNWAEGLLAGKRTLPESVIRMREKELIARQKAAQDEETLAFAARAKAERDAMAAAEKARRAEERKAAREAQEQEREQLIPERLRAPWKAVQKALDPSETVATSVSKPSWETHIRPLKPVRLEEERLVMGAPSNFIRDWVQKRLLTALREAWMRELGVDALAVEVVLLAHVTEAVLP